MYVKGIARDLSGIFLLFYSGDHMKKIIIGIIVIVFGLLISLGPQFLFKVCDHGENGYPGACMIVFTDPKTRLGLIIGVFMASLIAFAIPHTLIGGCSTLTMKCHRIAFPALTVESIVLLVFSAIMITVIAMRKPPAKTA